MSNSVTGSDSQLPSPEISGEEYEALKLRLAASKFRSRFRLGEKEVRIVAETGFPVLRGQCRRFIQERLAACRSEIFGFGKSMSIPLDA